MPASDDEQHVLESVVLQNAVSILRARQRAEEALQKQSEWLRITLASIGDAVISTDDLGRVTFLNGVAEFLTGWTQAEAAGQPLADVFHIVNETNAPACGEPCATCPEGRIRGRAGKPHDLDREGRHRAAGRRQRRPDARRGRGNGGDGPGLSRRHRAKAARRRRGASWRRSSIHPRTRSSASRSRASSSRGILGPSGSSATPVTKPSASRSP